MAEILSFFAGGVVGVVGGVVAHRARAYRLVLLLLRSLRERAADEESVVAELHEDLYFAREYARPEEQPRRVATAR